MTWAIATGLNTGYYHAVDGIHLVLWGRDMGLWIIILGLLGVVSVIITWLEGRD